MTMSELESLRSQQPVMRLVQEMLQGSFRFVVLNPSHLFRLCGVHSPESGLIILVEKIGDSHTQ